MLLVTLLVDALPHYRPESTRHHSTNDSVWVPCRSYNNIGPNCADPSRNDFDATWCNDFQSLCKRYQNATNGTAAQQQIAEEGLDFLGAPIGLACTTWNGEQGAWT